MHPNDTVVDLLYWILKSDDSTEPYLSLFLFFVCAVEDDEKLTRTFLSVEGIFKSLRGLTEQINKGVEPYELLEKHEYISESALLHALRIRSKLCVDFVV